MQHDYQAVMIIILFMFSFIVLFSAFFHAVKMQLEVIYIPALITIAFECYVLAGFLGAFNG